MATLNIIHWFIFIFKLDEMPTKLAKRSNTIMKVHQAVQWDVALVEILNKDENKWICVKKENIKDINVHMAQGFSQGFRANRNQSNLVVWGSG